MSPSDVDVVELPLLLPSWQADALEALANGNGLTTGQMLRRLIGDLLDRVPADRFRERGEPLGRVP